MTTVPHRFPTPRYEPAVAARDLLAISLHLRERPIGPIQWLAIEGLLQFVLGPRG